MFPERGSGRAAQPNFIDIDEEEPVRKPSPTKAEADAGQPSPALTPQERTQPNIYFLLLPAQLFSERKWQLSAFLFAKIKDSFEKQGMGSAGTLQSRPVGFTNPSHSSRVMVNTKRKGVARKATVATQIIFPSVQFSEINKDSLISEAQLVRS